MLFRSHQTVVKKYGATEALFVSPIDSQTILEGTTFSLFVVDGHDSVITPPVNGTILDGITRKVILELVRKAGITAEERKITLAELSNVKEVLLTSSTRNIVPVVKVDDTVIGDGVPGPMVKLLNDLLADYQRTY